MNWDDPHIFEAGTFISADDVLKYAYLTNDLNPIHLIESAAKEVGFERPIAHGMLVASYISSTLSDYFGEGTVYVAQSVKFIKPVYVDSEIAIKLQNPTLNLKGRTEVQTNVWLKTKKRKGGEDFFIQDLVIIGRAEVIPGKQNYKPS